MSLPTVKIGLLQDQDRGSMAAAADHTEQLIREAAAKGAQIICTQELFLTEYFCWKQDSAFFDLAVPIPSEWTDRFCRLAGELSVVLVLSLFERRAPGLSHNTAVVIDADGTLMGKYRKMHIPQDPGFEEKFYFSPGDLPFRSFHTRYADIGVLVCWDQWYPEAARLTGSCVGSCVCSGGNERRRRFFRADSSFPSRFSTTRRFTFCSRWPARCTA